MLRRPRTALLGALACLGALVVTGALSHLVPAAKVRDSASLKAFASFDSTSVNGILNGIAHTADPGPYLIVMAGLIVVALRRHRPRLALVVPAVLLAGPVTTEVLKQLTAQQRGGASILANISEASWPSGHSTGAMGLALCTVLVVPPRLRPLAGTLGGIYALAVGYSVLALIWHFPSDVVGGYLVAAGWTLLAVAALRRWPDRAADRAEREEQPDAGVALALAVAGAAAIVALLLAFRRRGALADQLAAQPAFAVAAAVIAVLAVGLTALLVRSAGRG